MNGWKTWVLAFALLGSMAGCIPTQRQLRMEQDLEEMKRRLAQAERSVAAMREDRSGKTEERLESLNRQQADLLAGLDTLRVEFQSVNGRMEDMTQTSSRMRDDLSLVQNDLSLKVTALEDRLARLEASRPAPSQAAAPAETAQSLYESGLELIQNEGDFAKGRERMEAFLKRYPEHELAVNATYWIGETFYGEKKYENAILQFQDVIQKYPEHSKVPAAMLKQGLSFHAMKDVKNARVILQQVVDRFPKTDEAKKAKKRLAEWK